MRVVRNILNASTTSDTPNGHKNKEEVQWLLLVYVETPPTVCLSVHLSIYQTDRQSVSLVCPSVHHRMRHFL